MLRASRALALGAAIAALGAAATLGAGDWEIDVHGGGLWTLTPSAGQITRPPAGEMFETVVPGVFSRRVSSWYYGEGGLLLQRKASAPVTVGNYTFADVRTLGSLDPVLLSAAVRWPFGGAVGVRLGRRLNRRLTAEINFDWSARGPAFSKTARTRLEDSRSSFEGTWVGLLSWAPERNVTSQLSVVDGQGHRLIATGVLNVNLETGEAPKWSRRPPKRRFVAYLTFGAGVATGSDEASATLVGRYRFTSPPGEPGARFEETDTVTVRSLGMSDTAFVGVAGLGWKQDLSPRWGLRFDARAYLSANRTRMVLDARPSVTTERPASVLVKNIGSATGAIQFVNDSSAYEGQRSSLSGPAVVGFQTFEGSGLLTQINVTFGVFWRF